MKNLGRSYEELRKILRSFENRAPAFSSCSFAVSDAKHMLQGIVAVKVSCTVLLNETDPMQEHAVVVFECK